MGGRVKDLSAPGRSRALRWLVLVFTGCMAVAPTYLEARPDYGNRLGQFADGKALYYATGSGMLGESFAPSLMKWYLPQELIAEHRWPWEYTNYARAYYRRYVDPIQEGDFFYDLYGRFLAKGWLVYDWRQQQPVSSEGSGILKARGAL